MSEESEISIVNPEQSVIINQHEKVKLGPLNTCIIILMILAFIAFISYGFIAFTNCNCQEEIPIIKDCDCEKENPLNRSLPSETSDSPKLPVSANG